MCYHWAVAEQESWQGRGLERGGVISVTLLSYTPNPEATIAAAARLSTSAAGAAQLKERMTPQEIQRLLGVLLTSGHLSPFEHASFTFAIEGISRVTSHQLVRHRLASYTQQSQRYVSMKKLSYITPPAIQQRPGLLARFEEFMGQAHQLYRELMEEGIAGEDARYVLPNAAETKIVMTVNARELMHAAGLRLCLRAQWEIVHLFEHMKVEVDRVAPSIAREMVPKCYPLGYCDERESCGLMPTLAEVKLVPSGGRNS